MAPPRNGPLFLARRPYRQRRIMDAARVLPILGAVLFALPVIWSGNPFRAGSTAGGGIYLFAVWAGLILGAAVLSRRLGRIGEAAPPPAGEDEDG